MLWIIGEVRIIRFVEKLNVLIKYLPTNEIIAMEHHFAIGHVYQAHAMADDAMVKLWNDVIGGSND